jgi:hypothetical protein
MFIWELFGYLRSYKEGVRLLGSHYEAADKVCTFISGVLHFITSVVLTADGSVALEPQFELK